MRLPRQDTKQSGFTLHELMMSIAIFSLVMAGAYSVYFTCFRSYWQTEIQTRTARTTAMAIQKMIYGVSGSNGLRSAITTNVVISSSNGLWSLHYSVPDGTSHRFYYGSSNQCILYSNSTSIGKISTVATNVVLSSITAATNGVSVFVRSRIQEGRYHSSNSVSTFIQYRN